MPVPDSSQFTSFAKGRANTNFTVSVGTNGPKSNSIAAAMQYSVTRRGAQLQNTLLPTVYTLTQSDLDHGSNQSLIILNSAGLIIRNITGDDVFMSYYSETSNGQIESLTSPGSVGAGASFTDKRLFSRGIRSLPPGNLLLNTTNSFTASIGGTTYVWSVGSIILRSITFNDPTQTSFNIPTGVTSIDSNFFNNSVLNNITTITLPTTLTSLPSDFVPPNNVIINVTQTVYDTIVANNNSVFSNVNVLIVSPPPVTDVSTPYLDFNSYYTTSTTVAFTVTGGDNASSYIVNSNGSSVNTNSFILSGNLLLINNLVKQTQYNVTLTAINSVSSATSSVALGQTDSTDTSTELKTWRNSLFSNVGSNLNWSSIASSYDGSILIACQSYGSVWVSRDYGFNWTKLRISDNDSGSAFSSVACSQTASTMIVAHNGGSIWISKDTGNTWTEQRQVGMTNKNWISVKCGSTGRTIIAVNTDRNIWKTTTGGGNQNWSQTDYTTVRNWRSVACDTSGGKFIACVSGGSIWLSRNDSGVTWTEVRKPGMTGQDWTSVACDDNGDILLACAAVGSIWKSPDGGVTWSQVTQSGMISQAWRTIASSGNGSTFAAAAGPTGAIWVSKNLIDWTRQQQSNIVSQNWSSICINNSGSQISACVNGGDVFVLDSSTSLWQPINNTTMTFNKWTDMYSSRDGSIQVACDLGGSIWISKDSGSTWNKVSQAGMSFRNWKCITCSLDGNVIVAAVDGGSIWISRDGGDTWVDQTQSGLENRVWTSVACSDYGSIIYACTKPRRGVSGSIWYLNSTQVNYWRQFGQTVGDRNWFSVACSFNGAFIIGAEFNGKIGISMDYGENWTYYNEKREWTSVTCSNDFSKLAAVDMGGGVYTSINYGVNWTKSSLNVPSPNLVHISSCGEGAKLLVCDSRRSLWMSKDSALTWEQVTDNGMVNQRWESAHCSNDGTRMMAGINQGAIWITVPSPPINIINNPLSLSVTKDLNSASVSVEGLGLLSRLDGSFSVNIVEARNPTQNITYPRLATDGLTFNFTELNHSTEYTVNVGYTLTDPSSGTLTTNFVTLSPTTTTLPPTTTSTTTTTTLPPTTTSTTTTTTTTTTTSTTTTTTTTIPGTLRIPRNVTRITNSAYYGNKTYTTLVFDEPSSCTVIENAAFYESNLTNVTLPSSLQEIQGFVFADCKLLTNVYIPPSVRTIGSGVFLNSTKAVISYPLGTTLVLNASGNGPFYGTKSATPYGTTTSTSTSTTTSTTLPPTTTTLPPTTTTLPPSTTSTTSTSTTTTTTLPPEVTGTGATFTVDTANNNGTLSTINITATTVTLPNTVKTIGSNVFRNKVSSMTSLTLPASLESVPSYGFSANSSLQTVVFSNSSTLTIIPEGTFSNNLQLTSVTLPPAITYIGVNALYGCRVLTTINIPSTVTFIDTGAFFGCRALTSLTLPSGLQSISNLSFTDCTSLTSLTIPSTVGTIGEASFRGCTSLTNLVISQGVTRIDPYAFLNCSALTAVTIPSSVTFIGEGAFENCTNADITYTAGTALGRNPFARVRSVIIV